MREFPNQTMITDAEIEDLKKVLPGVEISH